MGRGSRSWMPWSQVSRPSPHRQALSANQHRRSSPRQSARQQPREQTFGSQKGVNKPIQRWRSLREWFKRNRGGRLWIYRHPFRTSVPPHIPITLVFIFSHSPTFFSRSIKYLLKWFLVFSNQTIAETSVAFSLPWTTEHIIIFFVFFFQNLSSSYIFFKCSKTHFDQFFSLHL